jgi:iron complex outermembrane recepter protein
MNNKVVTALAAVAFAGTSAAGDNNLVIEITSGLPQAKNESQEEMTQVQASPSTDGGELLKSLPGVSGIRMGGRAIDPVIRGQSQTQLNILLDGATIHNACPNRMDPPTAYTSVDNYDLVTVIKGNRTVQYGAGGSGGTVLFERSWPSFDEKGYRGDLSSSYRDNGDRYELGADLAIGSNNGFVRVISHKASGNNYEDGDGNKVRSSYESLTNALIAGWQLGSYSRLEASFEKAEEEDVLFAGASMDSPFADAETGRLKFTHQFQSALINEMKLEVYRSEVTHNMDNYSLRPAGMLLRQAPSTSDTDGLRLVFDARFMDVDWKFGVDMQNSDRDAELQDQEGSILRLMWPDAEIDQQGLFIEGEKVLNMNDVVKAGLRYDHVSAEANRRDEVNAGFSPQQVWAMAGASAGAGEKTTEDNVGGFASWTHRLNEQYTIDTVLSRSVRTADATERYLARMTAMSDWIGNPELEPEKHHQFEVALHSAQGDTNWSATGWYNRVDDYILRESVAAGMKQRDIYRNVSAELFGAELQVKQKLTDNWALASTLVWIVGNNLDDGTKLSRISPLELTTSLDYRRDNLKAGASLRLVDNQNDVCLSGSANCGGQDVRKTPGYGVLDVHVEYAFASGVSLLAGVDNLLDKAYTLHESRDDTVNPAPFQVAEPGRSIWMRVSKAF